MCEKWYERLDYDIVQHGRSNKCNITFVTDVNGNRITCTKCGFSLFKVIDGSILECDNESCKQRYRCNT